MKRAVYFDIACNDPDNGSFVGKAHMISYQIGPLEHIKLEADDWRGYKFTDAGEWIRIHRQKFKVIGGKEWVGNWCWNRFKMERSEAKLFIKTLRESDRWRCTHGPTRWFEWFNNREPFLDPRTPSYGVGSSS